MKVNNIVPITYVPGTGGQFLSWFINNAQNNLNEDFDLSIHGNAHQNPFQYHGENNILRKPDDAKIKDVLGQVERRFPKTIWYPNLHVKFLQNALDVFEKIIRISVEENDFKTVNSLLVGKLKIDNLRLSKTEIETQSYIDTRLHDYWSLLVNLFKEEPYDNVLYVKFSDLLYGNYDFVEKISGFTNIPVNNFNLRNVDLWRDKTLLGLIQVKSSFERI